MNTTRVVKRSQSAEAERDRYHLRGSLPAQVETLDTQLALVRYEFDALRDSLDKHLFLRELQESNSVLSYAFLERNLEELLPIVYTPTVGDGEIDIAVVTDG